MKLSYIQYCFAKRPDEEFHQVFWSYAEHTFALLKSMFYTLKTPILGKSQISKSAIFEVVLTCDFTFFLKNFVLIKVPELLLPQGFIALFKFGSSRVSPLRPPMTKPYTRVRDDDLVIFILTNAILFHSFSKLFIIILMKFYIFIFID